MCLKNILIRVFSHNLDTKANIEPRFALLLISQKNDLECVIDFFVLDTLIVEVLPYKNIFGPSYPVALNYLHI